MIHVVEFPKPPVSPRIQRAKDEAEYARRHKRCPKCSSESFERTCMAFVMVSIATHRDMNRCRCLCGWRGFVHELVSSDETSAP